MSVRPRSHSGSRKTHFDTIPLPEALGRAREYRVASLRGASATPQDGDARLQSRPARHILSLSYDVALLDSRRLLLEQAGYQVTSVVGVDAALDACRQRTYDLVIIGHSIPSAHKQKLIEQLRAVCQTPVLGLQRSGERMENADHVFSSSEGPGAFLDAVERILGP